MDILRIEERGGKSYGYDGDSGQWYEIPPEYLEGGALGALQRGASQSVEDIGIGINQLLYPSEAANEAAAASQQRMALERAVNPWSAGTGQIAPELGLGVATAPIAGTSAGGLGLLVMLEGLLGASRSATDTLDRVENVAVAALGVALPTWALNGIRMAGKAAAMVQGSTREAVEAGVEGAARRVEGSSAGAQQADEAFPDERALGSVETDEALFDRQRYEADVAELEELNIPLATQPFSESAPRSATRSVAAGLESFPFTRGIGRSVRENTTSEIAQGNANVITSLAREAVGLPPGSMLSRMEVREAMEAAGSGINKVARQVGALKPAAQNALRRDLAKIADESSEVLLEGDYGQGRARQMLEAIRKRREGRQNKDVVRQTVNARELMATRSELVAEAQRAADFGEPDKMARLFRIVEAIDDAMEKTVADSGDVLRNTYATLRAQYRAGKVLTEGAAISGNDQINPLSLTKRLEKEYGPRLIENAAVERLYKAAKFEHTWNQTNVPNSGTPTRMLTQQLIGEALKRGGSAMGIGL